jgi:hypothetical protein
LQGAMAAVSFLMEKLGDDVNGLRWDAKKSPPEAKP